MSNDDSVFGTPQDGVVPMDTLERVADASAFEVWGENIGRGDPIPLSDGEGIYAYVFPYVMDAKRFPPHGEVLAQIRALRNRHHVAAGEQSASAAYCSELRRLGDGFGSICVSATYANGPVLWMSHFLPAYFILAGAAEEEARRQLGEDVRLRTYYYLSPEEQYIEFAAEADTLLVNANAPRTTVAPDVVRR